MIVEIAYHSTAYYTTQYKRWHTTEHCQQSVLKLLSSEKAQNLWAGTSEENVMA